jgi:hypothetical protein
MVSGKIWIDSSLPPAAVLENLRTRGREWRESAVPEDLRNFKVQTLGVEIKGSEFQMYWLGRISPFYNPLCFGTVEQTANGSRISAGFKLTRHEFIFMGAALGGAALPLLLGMWTTFYVGYFVVMLILLAPMVMKNRTAEPMRTRLIEVLTNAAGQSTSANDSLSTANVQVRQQILL